MDASWGRSPTQTGETDAALAMDMANLNLTNKKHLGTGSVGSVYRWDAKIAVKVIPTGQQNANMVAAAREFKIMAQL